MEDTEYLLLLYYHTSKYYISTKVDVKDKVLAIVA